MRSPLDSNLTAIELAHRYSYECDVISRAYLRSPIEDAGDTMALPVAVATWIRSFAPELSKRTELSIGLVGMHPVEDHGAWLMSVPWLLGHPELRVRFYLAESEVPPATTELPITYIPLGRQGVEQVLAQGEDDGKQGAGCAVELLLYFFSTDLDELLTGGWFKQALDKVPFVGGFSDSAEAAILETEILKAFHFSVDQRRPTHAEYAFGIGGYQHTLWKLNGYDERVDDVVEPLFALNNEFGKIFQVLKLYPYSWAALPFWGKRVSEASASDQGHEIVTLPAYLALCLKHYGVTAGPWVAGVEELFDELERDQDFRTTVDAWRDDFSPLARLQWAAGVFLDWIWPRFALLPDRVKQRHYEYGRSVFDDVPYDDSSNEVALDADDSDDGDSLLDEIFGRERRQPGPATMVREFLRLATEAAEQLDDSLDDEAVIYKRLLYGEYYAAACGLLEDASDPDELLSIEDADGDTLVMCLALTGRYELLQKVIVEFTPYLEFEDENGRSILHYVAGDPNDEVPPGLIESIIDAGVDVNGMDFDNLTPLAHAMAAENWVSCAALAKHQAKFFESEFDEEDIDRIKAAMPASLRRRWKSMRGDGE